MVRILCYNNRYVDNRLAPPNQATRLLGPQNGQFFNVVLGVGIGSDCARTY